MSELTGHTKRFRIVWNGFQYRVSIPNYDGGEVVPAEEYDRLRAALVKSIEAIQTWHNMSVPPKERSELWDIYWRSAPEMKQIREALSDDPRSQE